MPAVAIGTRRSQTSGVILEAVKTALLKGYRHIDTYVSPRKSLWRNDRLTFGSTAFAYGCEAEVGQAIKESGFPREKIWITTKLDNQWHHRVEEALSLSLKALDLEYVDLYLMHWPCPVDPEDLDKPLPNWHFVQTWCVTSTL